MKHRLLLSMALLSASVSWAQNSVVINQTGTTGNSAVVVQSGAGSHIHVEQSNVLEGDTTKARNQVSLRAPKGTQSIISQQSSGANLVELSPDIQATTAIHQSSAINANSVTILDEKAISKPGSTKRRQRRP